MRDWEMHSSKGASVMSHPENNSSWDDVLADLGLPGAPTPEKPVEQPLQPEEPAQEPQVKETEVALEMPARRGRKRPAVTEAPEEEVGPTEVEATAESEPENTGGNLTGEDTEDPSDESEPRRRRRRGRRKKKASEAEELSELSESETESAEIEMQEDAPLPTADHEIIEPVPVIESGVEEESEEFEQEQGLEEPLELSQEQEEGEGEKKRRRRRRRKKKGGQAPAAPSQSQPTKVAAVSRTIIEPRDLEAMSPHEEEEDEEESYPATSASVEDDEDDEIIDMSNWNIISWQDLIGGLYRPERDR